MLNSAEDPFDCKRRNRGMQKKSREEGYGIFM
jgi:hypothetical protein